MCVWFVGARVHPSIYLSLYLNGQCNAINIASKHNEFITAKYFFHTSDSLEILLNFEILELQNTFIYVKTLWLEEIPVRLFYLTKKKKKEKKEKKK